MRSAVTEPVRPAAGPDRRWWALVAMLLAAAMDLVDTTIINIAIPSIRRDLGGGAAAAEWTVAGYALAFGVMLITGGRLGDAFGRRRMFLLGVAGFMAASLVCGLAPAMAPLVAGRVVQGVAAAVMVPQILAVIQEGFTAAERPKAYAAYGACAAISTVSGPVLGGVLVQADLFGLGWRPIFLVNPVLGLAALPAAAAWLPETRPAGGPGSGASRHRGEGSGDDVDVDARAEAGAGTEASARTGSGGRAGFDLAGTGLLAAALPLLLYPLAEAPRRGWPAWSSALVAASGAVIAVFAAHQRHRARRGRPPLARLSLFRERGFTGGVVTQLALYAGVTGFFLVLALTLQAGLGMSALRAGLAFLPFSAGIAVSSGVSGHLAGKLGRRLTTAGVLAMAAGMAVLLVTVHMAGRPGVWDLAPGLAVAGLGMGMVAPTLVGIALAGVDARDAGAASGMVTTAGQLGGAIGVAACGAVFFGALPAARTATAAGPSSAHPAAGHLGGTRAAAVHLHAFSAALAYEIGVFLLAALLMSLLPRTDRTGASSAPSPDRTETDDTP